MEYLRNCWYVAGHAAEVGTTPIARTLLDEPVVIYRTEGGTLVAMDDRCPHRFAPLSRGRVCGEQLQCPYHGLLFDSSGQCVATPRGGLAPPRAKVRTYPIVERHTMLWIWMGDAVRADPSLIPDFSRLEADDADWFTGVLYAKGNYQLVVDNLLDLSHVEFIHPVLSSDGWAERNVQTVKQDGDTVWIMNVAHDDNVMGMALQMNPKLSARGTTKHIERWDPPSSLQLSVEYYSDGGNWIVPSGHFLTPESATTTHYFLRGGQTVDKSNREMTEGMKMGTLLLFQNEDIAMIEAQQRNLGARELMESHPAILAADSGAVRARRILAKRINDERESTSSSPHVTPIAVAS